MKKMYFKTMVILMAVTLAIGTTSCDKDEENEENGKIYTPPSDLSNDAIKDLLSEALENTLASPEFSASIRGKDDETRDDGGYNVNVSVNRNTKKAIAIFEDETLYRYIEDGDVYFYEGNESYSDKRKTSYSSFEKAFEKVFLEVFNLKLSDYNWKTSGDNLTGTNVINNLRQATVTLTGDRKLLKTDYRLDDEDYETRTFSYDKTNPAPPAGFNKADFE